MIKQAGIDFASLPDEEADSPLGIYTGAGTIFGVTGGVMEAALRSAHYLITNKDLDEVELNPVRGLDGVKEAAIDVEGTEVRVAIAHGMANINTVMERVREAKKKGEEPPYHFIEVMACRGGCIAGGGQPRATTDEVRKQRIEGLYNDDTRSTYRCSHHNPAIKKLYEEYLGAPLSEKAHELLHAKYKPRPIYQK
jgi:NADH-quinone oxidoreductase subunit G